MNLQTKIGLWIARTPAILFCLAEMRGTYKHTFEPWTAHAQFHSLTGMTFYLGLFTFFFMITGKPFKNREWWAWWSILIMGTSVHGAQLAIDWVNMGLRGGGTSQGSGVMFWYLAMLSYVFYLVGAFLTYSHFKKKD